MKQEVNVSKENSLTGRALNESFKNVFACLQLPTKIRVERSIFKEQKHKRRN